MYRIMIVKSKRDNSASLYQWLTEELSVGEGDKTTVESRPIEFSTEEELDAKVESMLNDEGYSKSDFIVVKYIDYTINATDFDI
jgi:hypothetical protein